MMNYIILIGLGIFTFTLTYMMFKFREQEGSEHGLLQLLLLFMILSSLLLVGKFSYDNKNNCEYLNTLMNVTGNETTLEYTYTCNEDINNTGLLFYQSVLWLWRFFIIYVVVFYGYKVLFWLADTVRGNY